MIRWLATLLLLAVPAFAETAEDAREKRLRDIQLEQERRTVEQRLRDTGRERERADTRMEREHLDLRRDAQQRRREKIQREMGR